MKAIPLHKIIRVILGSVLMGIGISFTIWANVGSDPMTVFWIGNAQKLSITVGQANIVVSLIILLFVFFMDKKQIHVGSLLNPLFIALTTDVLGKLTLTLDSYILRCILCVVGLLVLACGIAIYALADYGKGAYDALVFCISDKLHKSVGIVRTSCDISFAILGMLLGGPVAFGTLLAILCMGLGISFFIKKFTTQV